ncbi:MAG TPA: hypothetical protein PKD05_01720, partial [Candidatus Melainabacteria bacterium]|nr:hypothetical protein [Candidatus Melainabacteria bacterium]
GEGRRPGGFSGFKETNGIKQSEGSSASRQYTESRESEGSRGRLTAITPYGSSRIVDILVGDQLPRIC